MNHLAKALQSAPGIQGYKCYGKSTGITVQRLYFVVFIKAGYMQNYMGLFFVLKARPNFSWAVVNLQYGRFPACEKNLPLTDDWQ